MDNRNAEIAKIHIAKAQLGIDDDTYREMIFALTGKRSSADMNSFERQKTLDYLKKVGFKGKKARGFKGRPAGIDDKRINEKQRLLAKIEAHLADAKRPWSYAHNIAKQMFKIERVGWCDCAQLWKIVAALEYDQKRRNNKAHADIAMSNGIAANLHNLTPAPEALGEGE